MNIRRISPSIMSLGWLKFTYKGTESLIYSLKIEGKLAKIIATKNEERICREETIIYMYVHRDYGSTTINVPYQVCVFRADRKNKIAAAASDWLRHFQLLIWNRWTELRETWQETDLNVLCQICVFQADQKNKMNALGSDWLKHSRLLLWNR